MASIEGTKRTSACITQMEKNIVSPIYLILFVLSLTGLIFSTYYWNAEGWSFASEFWLLYTTWIMTFVATLLTLLGIAWSMTRPKCEA